MASNIEIRGISVKDLMDRLKDLAKNDILVGIPQSQAWVSGDVANNALLGYIHEFGSPVKNIPARSFLLPSIDENKELISKSFEKASLFFMDNKESEGINELEKLGMKMIAKIKNKIGSNIQPALAAGTLAARRLRGVTRTNTLIDTGAMQQSINYVRVIK
jgi:hypothetical protein